MTQEWLLILASAWKGVETELVMELRLVDVARLLSQVGCEGHNSNHIGGS